MRRCSFILMPKERGLKTVFIKKRREGVDKSVLRVETIFQRLNKAIMCSSMFSYLFLNLRTLFYINKIFIKY